MTHRMIKTLSMVGIAVGLAVILMFGFFNAVGFSPQEAQEVEEYNKDKVVYENYTFVNPDLYDKDRYDPRYDLEKIDRDYDLIENALNLDKSYHTTVIFVKESNETFKELKPGENNAGVYDVSEDKVYVSENASYETIIHETVHHITYSWSNDKNIPSWIGEGVSEYTTLMYFDMVKQERGISSPKRCNTCYDFEGIQEVASREYSKNDTVKKLNRDEYLTAEYSLAQLGIASFVEEKSVEELKNSIKTHNWEYIEENTQDQPCKGEGNNCFKKLGYTDYSFKDSVNNILADR